MLPVTVEHNAPQRRFQALVEGHLCVADYSLSPGVMHLIHTGVDASLAGRGIAAALIAAVFENARNRGLKIDPVCSYVRHYIQRHPEIHSLVVEP